MLTDKKCLKIVLHPKNVLNKDVFNGITDAMLEVGLSLNIIVVGPETGDVFMDCLEMAKIATGLQDEKI